MMQMVLQMVLQFIKTRLNLIFTVAVEKNDLLKERHGIELCRG